MGAVAYFMSRVGREGQPASTRPQLHPNDFDRKRIKRALKDRKRYRYVTPSVMAIVGGYLVRSPCCSRNVDSEGGVIDIAMLTFGNELALWQLHRRDHASPCWREHSTHATLAEALSEMVEDSNRVFWQ